MPPKGPTSRLTAVALAVLVMSCDDGAAAPVRLDSGGVADTVDAAAERDSGLASSRDAGDADGGGSVAGPPETIELPAGRAHLTFSEEFDVDALDVDRWNRWYTSPAVINEELQFYALDAFELGDGLLRIRAERESSHGFEYTSGAITTFGSFSQAYGYFEIRARLPAGNGLWPAFWLLPADLGWPPEIDVMEHLGEDPSKVYLTYHWTDAEGAHRAEGDSHAGTDYTAGFHTFAVDWRPEVLVWYVDGVERHRVEGPHVTSKPAYLLANLAVGGTWPVSPDDSTPLPAYYVIDHIRVYQYEPAPSATPIPIRLGKTLASAYVASPGDDIHFDVRVELAEALTHPLVVQAILYDEGLSTAVRSMQHTTDSPPAAGPVERRFSTTLPSDLSPGIYRLSVGLFRDDWTNLTWLSNAVVIEVR